MLLSCRVTQKKKNVFKNDIWKVVKSYDNYKTYDLLNLKKNFIQKSYLISTLLFFAHAELLEPRDRGLSSP